jgi:hypothetical protein
MTPRPRQDRRSTLQRATLALGLLFAALAALPAAAAQAAPPANDAFADAQIARVGDRVTGSTAEATTQASEPANDPSYTRSVWYRLTPSTTETLRIDTCSGSGPHWSELTIYTGTGLGDLTAVPLSRTGCLAGSRVYVNVTAATTYHVRVAGHDVGGGAIVLNVARPQAPANDNFANAQTVGRPAHITASNVDATVQPGEPEPPGFGGGHSVWYKLAATTTDVVWASTAQGLFGAMVAVYTGDAVNHLTEVGHEGGPTGQRTTMIFDTTPGTTYYIAVRGYGDDAGDFTLDVSAPDPPGSAPDFPDPPAPPCFPDADLITYTGTHSAGGNVCLKVTKNGTGVAWFSGTNIPGDRCTIPWFAEVLYSAPTPIDNRRFSFGSPSSRLIGAFPTNRGARGTLQATQRSARGPCFSAPIEWTATTTGTPPWADFTPPSLRLGGATVQRPLRGRRALVVLVRCRGESCGVSASATVAGVKVTAARRTVKASSAGRAVRLVLSARARRALVRALRSRRGLKVRVTVAARDAADNRTTARRTITLRR